MTWEVRCTVDCDVTTDKEIHRFHASRGKTSLQVVFYGHEEPAHCARMLAEKVRGRDLAPVFVACGRPQTDLGPTRYLPCDEFVALMNEALAHSSEKAA